MTYSVRVAKIMSRRSVYFLSLNTVAAISRIEKMIKFLRPTLLAPEFTISCGPARQATFPKFCFLSGMTRMKKLVMPATLTPA
jgi:hypothetical protein